MRSSFWLVALLVLTSLAHGVELKGKLTQGSLLRGSLPPGSKVWLDERRIPLAADGAFAIGFSRDDKLTWVLRWQKPGGATQQKALKLVARKYDEQHIDGLPPKMVTPPEEVLSRIRKDSKAVKEARSHRDDKSHFMQEFVWPSAGRISGVYGSRRILNGEPRRPHYGVDIAAPTGDPVYAPADGLVTLYVGDMYYSGGTLILDHGLGVSSTFLHLSKSHVKPGEKVKQGDLIAEIGATGRVTGAHLDWRMNWYEKRVDPQLLVSPEPPARGQ